MSEPMNSNSEGMFNLLKCDFVEDIDEDMANELENEMPMPETSRYDTATASSSRFHEIVWNILFCIPIVWEYNM